MFEGHGVIRDFPGNYTRYREAVNLGLLQSTEEATEVEKTVVDSRAMVAEKPVAIKKLSFKEKFEMEAIEKELPLLEEERKELETKLGQNLPYEELQKASNRISEIIESLNQKELRWLELSEKSGVI